MRKLTLDIDELEVVSFETVPERDGEGTVHGHETEGGSECNTFIESCVITACPVESGRPRHCPITP